MMLRKFLAASIGTASAASAFSLYDTAPMVGVQESKAVSCSLTMSSGYDTNPVGTTQRQEKKGQAFVNAYLSSSYADVESLDKVSYTARLGGTRYLGASDTGGRKYYGDCNLNASLMHSFSAGSRYTGNVHVSYMPEPGYDNGYSSAGMQGDTLSWGLDNTYSESIDARWSWNLGGNLSGTKYREKAASQDDRQYYGGMFGVNYRDSDLLTYTSSVSYRDELRSYGQDSQSVFASGGFQYSLSPVSSASASVGVQYKTMAQRHTMNPTVDLGYRRRVSDGLSMNAYVKYSDENVDNYSRGYGASYRTGGTWRVGAYGTYVLSPDVSYVFRMQVMQTQYRKSTNSDMPSANRYTINPSLSMNYSFTPDLSGSLSAEYTYYSYDRAAAGSNYTRWQLSAGLSYHF